MLHQTVVTDQSDAPERTPLAEDDAFHGRRPVVSRAGDRQLIEGAPGQAREPAPATGSRQTEPFRFRRFTSHGSGGRRKGRIHDSSFRLRLSWVQTFTVRAVS